MLELLLSSNFYSRWLQLGVQSYNDCHCERSEAILPLKAELATPDEIGLAMTAIEFFQEESRQRVVLPGRTAINIPGSMQKRMQTAAGK
jgi:hypothetical protein